MFTIILLFLKPFKRIIYKGIALVLLATTLYAAWYKFTGHYIDIGKQEVQDEWNKETAATKLIANKRKAEIDAAAKRAEAITKIAISEKEEALKKLGLEHINRLELTKRIEALNEIHNRKLADTKHLYDERLRLDATASNSRTAELRKESERFAQLSRSAPECDGIFADYDTLVQACQLTTIDFNSCRLAYDADTAACGREK